jgi:phosphoribosylformimino-5-aminoimidazole carboxamide ribotide isomerase
MKFRPCIDVHCGLVKQIVGSTLNSTGESAAEENFVSSLPPRHFADMYRNDKLAGGHVIMLGGSGEEECMEALRAYPGGMQIGGRYLKRT